MSSPFLFLPACPPTHIPTLPSIPSLSGPAFLHHALRSAILRIALCALTAVPTPLLAQALQPPTTGGAVALAQELRFLGHNKRVLMIGAHPDDEYTELLTLLARGMGAEAAYLSLNRGEGGQNLIGNELGEELGVLRTGELLASRQVDGARQYFTRAFDFGFSKSLDDTWAHWPKDSVLRDVVQVIRQFKPQIIVSVFSGTPRDGHGQHQAAGWVAMEAFRIAGDSTYQTFATRPWKPLKLYRSARFDSAGTSLVLEGGGLDEAVGQSYRQIAAKGRSFHRSQDMGQLQEPGPSRIPLQLVQDRANGGNELFAGIDTTLTGVIRTPRPPMPLVLFEKLMAVRPLTAENVRTCIGLLRQVDYNGNIPEFQDQIRHLTSVYLNLRGIQLDAYTRTPRIAFGQPDTAYIVAWNTSATPFWIRAAAPYIYMGSATQKFGDSVMVAPGQVGTIAIPYTGGPLRGPALTMQGRNGDMYTSNGYPFGAPFDAPRHAAAIVISEGKDDPIWVEREVVYRTNDQARGEVREPVLMVPSVDVKLDPASAIWRSGDTTAHSFTVTLTNNLKGVTEGAVSLTLPKGWDPVPPQSFRLTRDQERQLFTFQVRSDTMPAKVYAVKANVNFGTSTETMGVTVIAYPHVVTREIIRPAVAIVRIAPFALPELHQVGYVRGAADRVPEALGQAGVPIVMLTGMDIETKDLSSYQAIIIGPRAFETDPDLPAANDQLIRYAERGGLVITQYQQYGYFIYNMAPYPMTVGTRAPGTTATATASRDTTRGVAVPVVSTALLGGHDRVTNEAAGVTVLDSMNPIMRVPNRIEEADWKGWVQERGLYFAHSWSKEWKPLLSMNDPGEKPLQGGLLVAKVGKGTYVYTGLAFFRQLPAGVPGAFRLFANLLALSGRP